MAFKVGLGYDIGYNGYSDIWLYIITCAVIASGVAVIISKNPIISVLYLIFLFLCVSGYLMLLGLNFIALSYLLVYVGAVSILFLFILMLINIRISEILSFSRKSIPLAVFITTIFLFTIKPVLPAPRGIESSFKIIDTKKASVHNLNTGQNEGLTTAIDSDAFHMKMDLNMEYPIQNLENFLYPEKIFSNMSCYVYSNAWDNLLIQSSYINSIGNVLYTNYPLLLIITSLVLLLAMVGCIIITVKN